MTATPAPWTALPAPAALGHPDGTWLVVGPRGDNGEPHTIAVVMPCDDGTHPGRAQADAQLIAAAFAECQESTASFDTGWGHGDCPCRKTGVHRVHRCEHGTEWWERTAQDAATAPADPGEGAGTGSGPVDAHRGAEGFRPYDPSVSATGDQISVWGDDRELCIIDVSNAEVLRDMLDDMIGSLGGKSLRQAERARIAAFIRSQTPHYDGKIAALLNLIETDQMER